MTTRVHIAVLGAGLPGPRHETLAEEVGRRLAEAGAVVVCGGLGGAMAAACRGAKSAGGLTVGLLPGTDRADANPWVDVAIPTGLGEGRNVLVVRSADAAVAVGGEYGTLAEIALALRAGVPVVGLATWTLVRPDGTADTGLMPAADPAMAVALALAAAIRR
ncbi:MAG TPA: TIGR00725 family protein [Acidimicrobiales bacterium]|nr:TIGR00725 family protein [Acidimicrobiales bacterium]